MRGYLLQGGVVNDLLNTSSITVIGLLLACCYLLVMHIKELNKVHKEEKDFFRKDIRDLRAELKLENTTNTKDTIDMVEKYYVLTTKILDRMDRNNHKENL